MQVILRNPAPGAMQGMVPALRGYGGGHQGVHGGGRGGGGDVGCGGSQDGGQHQEGLAKYVERVSTLWEERIVVL